MNGNELRISGGARSVRAAMGREGWVAEGQLFASTGWAIGLPGRAMPPLSLPLSSASRSAWETNSDSRVGMPTHG